MSLEVINNQIDEKQTSDSKSFLYVDNGRQLVDAVTRRITRLEEKIQNLENQILQTFDCVSSTIRIVFLVGLLVILNTRFINTFSYGYGLVVLVGVEILAAVLLGFYAYDFICTVAVYKQMNNLNKTISRAENSDSDTQTDNVAGLKTDETSSESDAELSDHEENACQGAEGDVAAGGDTLNSNTPVDIATPATGAAAHV